MLQNWNEPIEAHRKAELYGEIVMKFVEQGAQKGAIYGAGVGVLIWIVGALFGAPIGALAGVVLGWINGLIVGNLVVYHDVPFATTGSVIAMCITASIVLIGGALMGVFNVTGYDGELPGAITIFLAVVAGFATWQGSCNVAEWYRVKTFYHD